jgi:hypothetical protein
MGTAVNLDTEFVRIARSCSKAQSRSVPKQIEHWAKIGRIVEDNPDLTYAAVKEMLTAIEDAKSGNVEEYRPGLL